MKISILLFGATLLAGACNSKSNPTEVVSVKTQGTTEVAKAKTTEPKALEVNNTKDNSTATPSEAMTSESSDAAKAKRGWSKTAKGAVIGGVVGAGTGAVVNKKNRAVGAVVGGIAGAGAGAIIGNEMDKKDGRH
jgi:uncharacterized protein YcfJ